jgi:PAS domain S-box-containing protein
MQLRLRTKLTLVMTGLVLAVVAVVSAVFVARLVMQVMRTANDRARFVAEQVFLQSQHALTNAAEQGSRPATGSPDDIYDYVRHAFEVDRGLNSLLDAAVDYSPSIDEVTIADRDGIAMLSSDVSLQGTYVPRRTRLDQLLQSGFFQQMRVLYGPPRMYEVDLPFNMSGKPFGDVRIGLPSALLRNELTPGLRTAGRIVLVALLLSTALAAVVSRATLAPLADISAQLDRISAGQFDPAAIPVRGLAGRADELGQVSQKITQVGQQLRGVHEIFSTLRDNLDQVMAGLEDGLILFTRDSRAVMVSPAAEKFLGAPAGEFMGRLAEEIFPAQHPLRQALRIEGGQFASVAATEVEIETEQGLKRVGVSVQPVEEDGTRMGALVTLRDLDSLESIGTQLQVSERLAALGRITAGVAHEVKNPLNSMRLWLENLREALPREQDGARHAVQVLDMEIDRLDTVVKRFLDFTKPMELRLEETQLAELLAEVVRVAQPQLRKAKVQVAQLLPIDVPPVRVDRALLKQAVLNLVLNAVEAMGNGGQLRLMLSRRGEMAEIAVEDTGRGIAPEHRQKVFQLFFTTRPGGSGIGLASTFRIVQLHNGSIDFNSEVGRGTTFRIELPLAS